MKLRFNNLNTISSASHFNTVLLLTAYMVCSIVGLDAWAKAKLDVKMNPQSDVITFDFSTANSTLKQNQVKINVNSKTKSRPLLSIEIMGVLASKKWFIEFTKSQYPDIKGILLKKTDKGGQLRIRYLKAVPDDFSKQIKMKQIDGRLQITVPTKVIAIPSAINPVQPTQAAKIKRVREITSALKEDSGTKTTPVTTAKNQSSNPSAVTPLDNKTASPSPLETGTHTPPLPPTDKMRRVSKQPSMKSNNAISPQVAGSSTRKQPSLTPKATKETLPKLSQKTTPIPNSSTSNILTPKTNRKTSPSSTTQNNNSNNVFGQGEDPFEDWQYWFVAGLFFLVAFVFLIKGKKQAQMGNMPASNHSILSFAEQHMKGQNNNSDRDYSAQNQVHILSEKVVNQDPVQKVIVVEVADQKLLIGSSQQTGLSFLTNLTPIEYQNKPANDHDYNASYEQYHQPYEHVSRKYSESRPVQPLHETHGEYYDDLAMQDYAENTYVNDSSYTDELNVLHSEKATVETVGDHYPTRNVTQRAQEAFKPDANQYASNQGGLSDLNPLVENVQDSTYQSEHDANDEVEDVSADDLLQKIRQLNRG